MARQHVKDEFLGKYLPLSGRSRQDHALEALWGLHNLQIRMLRVSGLDQYHHKSAAWRTLTMSLSSSSCHALRSKTAVVCTDVVSWKAKEPMFSPFLLKDDVLS
jgi:hypothetical protein